MPLCQSAHATPRPARLGAAACATGLGCAAATLALLALPLAAQAQMPSLPGAGLAALAAPTDWHSLNPEQRTALQPLEKLWPGMNAEQQRKWIVLVQDFHRMNAQERQVLQGRMSDWARLSPAERTRARHNFDQARSLPADEKRAKWQAYQALPPEQREQLARQGGKPPLSAAPALRPGLPPQAPRLPKTAAQPATAQGGMASPAQPPAQVNRNTLLPTQPAPGHPRPGSSPEPLH